MENQINVNLTIYRLRGCKRKSIALCDHLRPFSHDQKIWFVKIWHIRHSNFSFIWKQKQQLYLSAIAYPIHFPSFAVLFSLDTRKSVRTNELVKIRKT